MKRILKKTFISAAALPLALAALPVSAETEKEFVDGDAPSEYSVSLEGVYAKALKKADRGGVDMAGLDLRLNYAVDDRNQLSLGLLMIGGSESVSGGQDLDTSNFGLLAGYRIAFPFLENRVKVYAGVRAGFVYVDYVLDSGRFDGWDVYRQDSDFCAAYAAELGVSYAFSDRWSVRGGYEFYGNTATLGGGDAKFGEQQYHLFQLGAEYRF